MSDVFGVTRRETILGLGAGLCASFPLAASASTRRSAATRIAADFSGGLDPSRDYFLEKAPVTPRFREAVNIWAWSDDGEIGLPRIAIEAVAPDWSKFDVSASATFTDGRTLRYLSRDEARPTKRAAGEPPRFLGAGPLDFECVEPFKLFKATYNGSLADSTFRDMAKRNTAAGQASVELELFYEPTVPPWIQGTMSEEARRILTTPGPDMVSMGGDRFEQLCRCWGKVRIDDVERPFSGSALRIRRRGVRDDADFRGHCWQSAVFPDGRAFGCNSYPPRENGEPTYNEGYIYLGKGDLLPARVIEAPWLHHLQSGGEDVSLVLDTAKGRIRIEGVTVSGMPRIGTPGHGGHGFPPLLQGIARYRWDGENAYGMIERSNVAEKVRIP